MWMRVDDGLHAHRKTRAVTKGGEHKMRDAAPMGLWTLAGSWSGRNNQDGWVPCDELDRFDDDWEALAKRLVVAGFWWPEQRNGEDGYGFNDWGEWNNPTGPSASGTYGNHVRWHEKKGVIKPDCELCPKEPADLDDEPDHRPDSHPSRPDDRPDIAPTSGCESHPMSPPMSDLHRPDSLTRPEPNPTRPEPEPKNLLSDEPDETNPRDRFDEFWDTYGHKVDRKGAEAKWLLALKKPGVTPDLLIDAAGAYIDYERSNEGGRYVMGPAKWLLGERWRDERKRPAAPVGRIQQHLNLVEQLAAEEAEAAHQPREIGQSR